MNAPTSTGHLIPNDRGGITYAPSVRIGLPEHRQQSLGELRMAVDGLSELCEKVRERWPAHTAIPDELKAMLGFQDYVIARCRKGSLAWLAKAAA